MKRKILIILVLIMTAASLPATAGEFKQWLKSQYEATHYQQDTFALEDPKGDAFLIRKLDQVPMKLLQALVKSSYPQAEIQKEKELKALEEGKKEEEEVQEIRKEDVRQEVHPQDELLQEQ